MSDRSALYHSVLAHPDDDTPRLVYADWLEENGFDEEAEFIRVECRLESGSPVDADHDLLLERQQELRQWLSAHTDPPKLAFPAGLRVDSGKHWWNQTRRGFPRFLTFDANRRPGLRAIRELVAALTKAFAALPTRWLVVRSITVEQLAALLRNPVIVALDGFTIELAMSDEPRDDACRLVADCPHLRNLHVLSINFAMSEVGAGTLARSEHLGGVRRFVLNPSALTQISMRQLSAGGWFRGLNELVLAGNCPAAAFEELCRHQPFADLHTLDLSDNDFSTSTWQTFARGIAFPAVAELDLSRTDMSNGRFEAFASARAFWPRSLHLTGCAIGNDGAAVLTRAHWTSYLNRLVLRNNGLTVTGTAEIARNSFGRLQHLDLANNVVSDRTLRTLTANASLNGLTALDLFCGTGSGAGRGPKPEHFERFLGELDMPRLRHLDLSGHPVGPRAARLLAEEKFGSLTRLELGGCKLTDTAVAALLAAPSLQNLVELDLMNNGLKSGVSALADRQTMPRLSLCSLQLNPIPPEIARKLRRRRGILL